jgi:hypothetical protein
MVFTHEERGQNPYRLPIYGYITQLDRDRALNSRDSGAVPGVPTNSEIDTQTSVLVPFGVREVQIEWGASPPPFLKRIEGLVVVAICKQHTQFS